MGWSEGFFNTRLGGLYRWLWLTTRPANVESRVCSPYDVKVTVGLGL